MVYRTSTETQLRKEQKKLSIMRAAALIFSEYGYSRTTIAEIVKVSCTSVGSFYFYFPSKEALFEELYDQAVELFNRISEYALEKPGNHVRGFCRSKAIELWIFQNYRGLARAMLIESVGVHPQFEQKRREMMEQSHRRVELVFEKIIRNGDLGLNDARVAALLCNGTLYSVVMDWLQRDTDQCLTDLAFPIITFNLNAFKITYDEADIYNYIAEALDDVKDFYSLL